MPKKKTTSSSNQKNNEDFDQKVDHFAEEVENLGKCFGNKMEQKGKELEGWFDRTFRFFGPLLSSIIGLFIIGLIIWLFNILGNESEFIVFTEISLFLRNNLALFFGLLLFFSYSSYASKRLGTQFKWISPIITSLGITIMLWIVVNLFQIIDPLIGISLFSRLANIVQQNLVTIFILITILGYLLLVLVKTTQQTVKTIKEEAEEKEKTSESKTAEKAKTTSEEQDEIKRLYRSGKDKILGGVCGGIADYVRVDPVIIRLLWVIATLASFGGAILAYIIFWIIIPRNPEHHWH